MDLADLDMWIEDLLSTGNTMHLSGTSKIVVAACAERRYFATGNGRISLGPENIMTGALICVFFSGRPVSYTVRRSRYNSNYTFVGESYVHGLISSEVFDMLDQDDIQTTTFELE
ncbi:hypothetical protein N431DRAFT_454955 [Stipitochalara longipes BDJ]|nr:hypothetical protein N431DRAFT_454955 [Stipitochalara longipes BDJ]